MKKYTLLKAMNFHEFMGRTGIIYKLIIPPT